MTPVQLTPLIPLLILSISIVIIMLVIAFYRNHVLTLVLSIIALALSVISLPFISGGLPQQVTALLSVDSYAVFFWGLIMISSIAVALISYQYFDRKVATPEEFYIILLLATLGSCILAASSDFVSFFVGLEILSVSLYSMIAYTRPYEKSIEAGLKYLILAAVSAAFLLFGMALVYAETGTMEFAKLSLTQVGAGGVRDLILLTGYGLIIVGIGFKLALVPFHLWTPDVYEGAPAPVTAFVATISKGAMFALLLRYFYKVGVQLSEPLIVIFTVIAIASILIGNFLGLLQKDVKRLLAYSSIAHLGYLLVAFLASGVLAATAVAFYLVAYFATTLGAFGMVTLLSTRDHEAGDIDDFRGMFWRHPWLTAFFTVMLFSLAGIPLTAGFVGKFYIVLAGVGSSLWLPVVVLVVGSAIGLFYYLRVIVVMYVRREEEKEGTRSVSVAGGVVIVVLTLFIVWIGVYPAPLLNMIQAMVGKLI